MLSAHINERAPYNNNALQEHVPNHLDIPNMYWKPWEATSATTGLPARFPSPHKKGVRIFLEEHLGSHARLSTPVQ